MRRALVVAALLILVPGGARAVPRAPDVRPDAREVSGLPSYVRRVEAAVVGLHVRADGEAPSSARLGAERFASAIVFDARGYAVTVSYAVMDAVSIDARTRGGASYPARTVALDFETGLAIVRLEGPGPWPVAPLGHSLDVTRGALTGTVGTDEDNELVWVTGSVHGIRRFSAYWEYMLDRALFVAPSSPSWGGSAVVNERGEVIGISSLRLGEAPYVNLAIPVEKLTAVKDELIATGRVVSRPPRPWLGLYTVAVGGSVVVDSTAPAGPARAAGFRKGDRIVSVNGVAVATQEEFYEALWRGRAGDVVRVAVRRDGGVREIAVRSVDRYDVLGARRR